MVNTGTWRVWLELARVSNLPTVWTNVIAGWILAGGGFDQPAQLVWLLIGGSLLYTGGMFLNDAADAKWDREHRSERPIATGRVGENAVWIASVLFLVVGFLLAVLPGGADWMITLALVAAIVAYDLYHKPWKGSVIIMGACRVLLYLMAGSAVVGTGVFDHWMILGPAVALGIYICGITMKARSEAVASADGKYGSPLASVSLFMPIFWLAYVPTIFVSRIHSVSNLWAILLVSAAFFVLVIYAIRLMKRPPKSNIGKGVGCLLATIPVVDALAIAPLYPWLALAFMGCMPLLRLWQRKISAT